ncbi:MAG: hypothetical protein IJE89_05520 [Bacilli bacterium]|nr:hypothetical protein [Bacilli bacterium]
MKHLNNKGYLLVEIVLASVLAMVIAYFLTDLTIKLKNKNDDLLVKTLVSTDQSIIYNTIMNGIHSDGSDFKCDDIKLDVVNKKFEYKEFTTIISEYASLSNFKCEKIGDTVNIEIPLDVKQLPSDDFDVNINMRLSNEETINANKYKCEGDKRLGVYYVTNCVDGNCSYTTKNGLDYLHDFSLDTTINTEKNPTWIIKENDLKGSLSYVGDNCKEETWYVGTNGSNLNCRAGASKNTDIVRKFENCTELKVYRTTMKIDDTHNWFYYYDEEKKEGCYLYGKYLYRDKTKTPNCSSSSGSTGTTNNFCRCTNGKKYSCIDYGLDNQTECSEWCSQNESDISGNNNCTGGDYRELTPFCKCGNGQSYPCARYEIQNNAKCSWFCTIAPQNSFMSEGSNCEES